MLFPYDRLSVTSSLSAEEASERISAAIDDKPSWWSFVLGFGSRKKYLGRTTRHGFVLLRGLPYVNTYRPLIRIRVLPQKKGCLLDVVVFSPGAFLPLAIAIPWMIISLRNGQSGMFIFLLLFLSALHGISMLFYTFEKRNAIRSLESLISAHIGSPSRQEDN